MSNALHSVAGCRDNLTEARAMVRACEETFHKQIREALDQGHSVVEVASAAKLSRERVYQIRDGRR